MNITIDQIIETLKDESKRKQIEEIICRDNAKENDEDIYIKSNYYITYLSSVEPDNQKEYSLKNSEYYNHFDNQKDAIMIAKKQDAEKKLFHIAKHLNKECKTDWQRPIQLKYLFFYDYVFKKFAITAVDGAYMGCILFKSADMLPDIIRLMGEQSLKDYLMLEIL